MKTYTVRWSCSTCCGVKITVRINAPDDYSRQDIASLAICQVNKFIENVATDEFAMNGFSITTEEIK